MTRIGILGALLAAPLALNNAMALEMPEKNIHIPPEDEQQKTLDVAVTYDDDTIYLHYRFETDDPSWYHQYWRYEDGEWVRYGSGSLGPDKHGLYEDRISMMLDDGSVEGFDRFGGWMTVHEGTRSLTSAADPEEVRAHPVLGKKLGRSDVRKYLPESREYEEPGETSWSQVRSEEALERMRDQGEFLDLWQWRAHRSHPMGYADNGYILEYRLSSEGTSMYTTNWDDEADHPAYMFDPDATGKRALEWERLIAREYTQDDPYYLSEDNAAAFDPKHEWEEGDVIPQRFLRQPDGSRGAIQAEGGYEDGAWQVTLSRSLESPNPRDSKSLAEGETYNVAFAVHTGQVGQRWHRVSLPQALSLGTDDGDIVGHPSDSPRDRDAVEWHSIELIYPGQATWQYLHGEHTGSPQVRDTDLGVRDFHETDALQELLIEMEKELSEGDN